VISDIKEIISNFKEILKHNLKNVVILLLVLSLLFLGWEVFDTSTNPPTSNIHITGSEAGSITNLVATTTLNSTNHKILVSNGATNITITFPDALTCLGREYIISRAAGRSFKPLWIIIPAMLCLIVYLIYSFKKE
jgi:hypothetical protein